jgi:endonuclease/exonuclease/phosphatase family metal-dependent hydrolase
MKLTNSVFIALFIGILIFSGCDTAPENTAPIRVMSYNIKYDDKSDTLNGWSQRREQVVNLISFYEPDFVGTQEGLLHQLEYIESGVDSMKWIGVGRTDGKEEGEFSALFYDNERFELIADTDSTIWLSESPGEPGKSWDAALPRILSWGKFRDKSSQQELFVFNTHFDHIGDTARAESARLIVDTIKKVAGGMPVILTGDFNATPDSKPFANLTNGSVLEDAYNVSALPHVGPEFSFEGFKALDSTATKRRIDYIFVNDQVEVLKHAFISNFRDGRYPSDHLPVIADVEIR